MDLSFTEEQEALRGLAREVLGAHCTHGRLRLIERGPDRFDAELYDKLARANLLGVGVSEELGGIGEGFIELCIVLEEAGRVTAPVPLWSVLTGAVALARFGNPEQRNRHLPRFTGGGAPVVAALAEPGTDDPFTISTTALADGDEWILDGVKAFVPAADQAEALIIPALADDGIGLFLVEREAVTLERQQPKGTEALFEVTFDGALAEALAHPPAEASLRWLVERATVALCAEQVGVAEAALRMTAEYTSGREQFGKPIGSFQAVQQRAADAYIDVEAMRWTMWEAAWRLNEGLDAAEHVEVAKVWASEGAARVLATAQHLHGGMGVDLDYPLHRYTFAARRNELALGGAAPHVARLGELLA